MPALDRATLVRRATLALADDRPEFSARRVFTPRQAAVLAAAAVAAAVALLAVPHQAAAAMVAAMSAGFLFSLVLRAVLALHGETAPAAAEDAVLPLYTILVPVYREAHMIGQIARALARLDYPAHQLDILLVVEEDDMATRLAVGGVGLRAVVVPASLPRTKPKACNYALGFARGEFLVVYDAEDRPEPDQLRKAVAAFRRHGEVSCFQARLAIDRTSVWLERMFAIDYALWFRTLLPGLGRLRAPIPLGGTSNHFRTAALVEAGAWDPFNVTEDADLGLRLARLGHRVAILDSTTFEEAPGRLQPWLRQRTRWMKGYMQTLLVHTRRPMALVGAVGWRGSLVSLSLLGGAVWSALVNPLLWIVCLASLLWPAQGTETLAWFARFAGLSLLAANGILAGLAVIGEAGGARKAALVFTYPLYWLLISAATYRALWQLLRDPFRWEKTPHGAAGP